MGTIQISKILNGIDRRFDVNQIWNTLTLVIATMLSSLEFYFQCDRWVFSFPVHFVLRELYHPQIWSKKKTSTIKILVKLLVKQSTINLFHILDSWIFSFLAKRSCAVCIRWQRVESRCKYFFNFWRIYFVACGKLLYNFY